jgi:hypothetical protein
MNADVKEIQINGITYVPKIDQLQTATKFDGLEYVIIRTYSAGVFAGYLVKRDGKESTLRKVRRLWYWDGAASLSQLAVDGVSKPQNCKFAVEVDSITVTETIEIILCTEKARLNIQGVISWKM